MNAFTLAQSIPWAMQPAFLTELLAIASRESSDRELAATIREGRQARQEAVLTARGRPLDGARSVQVRDGVALLPVMGPIFRYSNFFSEYSGGATIDTLARDFQAALDAPGVSAIVLHIDSPGGEITGVAQFAAQVYAARGIKPVVAYVEGLGASAAYWIAAAAGELVLDSTALVGSIGVVQAMPNPAAKTARDIEIVSSQSPLKRVDPTTEGGKATIQATVDELADLFIAAVALYRDTPVATVAEDFGRGGVLVGASAVAAGMADTLDSLEATIARLAQGHTRTTLGVRMEGDAALQAALLAQQTTSEENATLKAELAAFKAEQAKAQADARKRAAVAFAESHIKAERFVPAQAANLEALYTAAMTADALPALEALTASLPAKPIAGERIVVTPLALDRGDEDAKTVKTQATEQMTAYAGNGRK